jgi:8-amino-7-oxononanoate synthase
MGISNFQIAESESPIQLIFVSGNEAAKQFANKINQAGFAVKAILHPTVAEGNERLRICIHSFNTAQEIEDLAKLFKHE